MYRACMGRSTRDYSDPAYAAWRRRVFRRDGWRCRMPDCPRRTEALNAHHIKRWADAPELRYVTSNGISLCVDCHLRVTGREAEYERLFAALVGPPACADFLIRVLMARHAKNHTTAVHGAG